MMHDHSSQGIDSVLPLNPVPMVNPGRRPIDCLLLRRKKLTCPPKSFRDQHWSHEVGKCRVFAKLNTAKSPRWCLELPEAIG